MKTRKKRQLGERTKRAEKRKKYLIDFIER